MKNVNSTRASGAGSNCLPRQGSEAAPERDCSIRFTVGMLADLACSGLATGHRETVRIGHRKIKVARIRITDAGRRALKG
jgi:hypothetical protein